MTCYEQVLAIAANWAAILTAVVAVCAYGRYVWVRRHKRSRLEKHLKAEKAKETDKGQRGIPHLVAKLGMSESDVLEAAFQNKRIRRVTDEDKDGFATKLMLEYVGD